MLKFIRGYKRTTHIHTKHFLTFKLLKYDRQNIAHRVQFLAALSPFLLWDKFCSVIRFFFFLNQWLLQVLSARYRIIQEFRGRIKTIKLRSLFQAGLSMDLNNDRDWTCQENCDYSINVTDCV